MVANVQYWYYSQIRTILLHTLRIFSNFQISIGNDDNGKPILQRVPCIHASSDKSAMFMINKGSENILETCPKMILAITGVKLNTDKQSGPANQPYTTVVNEKRFNSEIGNYEYDLGNSVTVTRLNPVPLGLTFTLYVLTTMLEQKCQLFEQIRPLFTPTLDLQTSENPLDWTRLTAITMTNLNWSSKGVSDKESTLDMMEMTFEVNTNLDAPALLEKNSIIENIVINMGEGDSVESTWGWTDGDFVRTIYTPTDNIIMIDDNNVATLIPNKKCKNWNELLKFYRIKYNANKNNIFLHCNITTDYEKRKDIIGTLLIDNSNPIKANWIFDDSKLPQTNVKTVNEVINPHTTIPTNETVVGTRFLITESIAGLTDAWGEFKDKNGVTIDKVDENCIIEKTVDGWVVDLNPNGGIETYYVRSGDNAKFLYTFDDDQNTWVDVINGRYRPNRWKISSI